MLLIEKIKTKKPLEILMYGAVIFEGFVAIPQVFDIFSNKSAENVSLSTWLGYVVLSIIWLAYSISVKDRPIILYSLISIISNGAIVAGILLY